MGVAESTGPNSWRLRRDFDKILRALQRTADRQRTLAAHGALQSDERLHMEVLDLRQLTSVEGRVLVHAQDEQNGAQLPDARGNGREGPFIQYTPGMEQARNENSFHSYAPFSRFFFHSLLVITHRNPRWFVPVLTSPLPRVPTM